MKSVSHRKMMNKTVRGWKRLPGIKLSKILVGGQISHWIPHGALQCKLRGHLLYILQDRMAGYLSIFSYWFWCFDQLVIIVLPQTTMSSIVVLVNFHQWPCCRRCAKFVVCSHWIFNTGFNKGIFCTSPIKPNHKYVFSCKKVLLATWIPSRTRSPTGNSWGTTR